MMPTIVIGWPSNAYARPTTAGSPANVSRQNR